MFPLTRVPFWYRFFEPQPNKGVFYYTPKTFSTFCRGAVAATKEPQRGLKDSHEMALTLTKTWNLTGVPTRGNASSSYPPPGAMLVGGRVVVLVVCNGVAFLLAEGEACSVKIEGTRFPFWVSSASWLALMIMRAIDPSISTQV